MYEYYIIMMRGSGKLCSVLAFLVFFYTTLSSLKLSRLPAALFEVYTLRMWCYLSWTKNGMACLKMLDMCTAHQQLLSSTRMGEYSRPVAFPS